MLKLEFEPTGVDDYMTEDSGDSSTELKPYVMKTQIKSGPVSVKSTSSHTGVIKGLLAKRNERSLNEILEEREQNLGFVDHRTEQKGFMLFKVKSKDSKNSRVINETTKLPSVPSSTTKRRPLTEP